MGAIKPRVRTDGGEPTDVEMDIGELAAQRDSGRLFYKRADGTKVPVGGAAIDDAVTVADKTWSSNKIAAEVAAAGDLGNTTPAPNLSVTTVNGNAGTSSDVLIQNYNGAHTYTVTSDNETYVTVSRSTNTVTINLLTIDDAEADQGGTRTATVTVTAFDAANDAFAGITTVAVTSNRVTINDAAIQQVDFSTGVVSSTGIAIDANNKPEATANAAHFLSDTIAQDGGEGNWLTADPSVKLKVKNFKDVVTIGDGKLFTTDASVLAMTRASVVDSSATVKEIGLSPREQAHYLANSSSWTTDTSVRPDWWQAESYNRLRSMQSTYDGKHLIAAVQPDSSSSYIAVIVKLDRLYDIFGTGTVVSEIDHDNWPRSFPSGRLLSSSFADELRYSMNNDGTRVLGQAYINNSNQPAVMCWELTTPFDLSTAVAHSDIAPTPYTSAQDEPELVTVPFFSLDGSKLLWSMGRMYDSDGRVYISTLATPYDLSVVSSQSLVLSSSSRLYQLCQLSPDGKMLLLSERNDDGAATTGVKSYDVDWDANALQNRSTWSSLASTTGSVTAYYDAYNQQLRGTVNFSTWYSNQGPNRLWPLPAFFDITGPQLTGDIAFVGQRTTNPDLQFDVKANAVDLNAAAETALVPQNLVAGPTVIRDPQWAEVELLFTPRGGVYREEKSGGTPTIQYGTPSINDAQSVKHYANIVDFDSGDILDSGVALDETVFNSDFTLEAWVLRHTSTSGWRKVIGAYDSVPNRWFFAKETANRMAFFANDAIIIAGSTTISTDVWYHVCLERVGDVWTLYVNGVQDAQVTADPAFVDVVADVMIGGDDLGSAADTWVGSIDSIRLTAGTARYGAPFTPPNGPFPIGANEVISNLPSWSWNGTDMTATVTYPTDIAINGDNLEYRVSDIDIGTIIEYVKFDLTRVY